MAIVLSIVAALVLVVGFVIAGGSSSRLTSRGAVPVNPTRPTRPAGPAVPADPTAPPIVPGATVLGGSPGSAVPAAPLPFADPGARFRPRSAVMPLNAYDAYQLQTGGSDPAGFVGYLGGHNRTWTDSDNALLRITILQFADAGDAEGAQATIVAFWQRDHRTVQPFDAIDGAMAAEASAASSDANQGIHTVAFIKGSVLVVVRLSRDGAPTDDIDGVALAQYDALG